MIASPATPVPKAAASHSAAGVETHSIDYVPERERTGRVIEQGPFWFLGNFHFFTLSIGFIGPSMGLSAGWSALAGALGILFGTLFMAFHGSQGPELGLPQMIQSRAQFGYRGVILVLLGTLMVFVGFNVVNATLLGAGLHNLFGWDTTTVVVISTVLAVVLAIYGHDVLHRAFKWSFVLSLPIYVVLTLFVLMGGVSTATAPTGVSQGFVLAAFATQFAAAASYNISYAPYVSDYSRYLPRNTPSGKLIAAIFGGASLSGIWMIGLGAWLATRISGGGGDALVTLHIAGSSLAPLFGTLTIAVSVIALVAVMGLNAYSGMLTVLTTVDSIRAIRPTRGVRIVTIIAVATIWLLITLTLDSQTMHLLHAFLNIMLCFLVPWTAVNLVDYFFVRRGSYAITHFFTPTGIYGAWGLRGIASYLIGFIAMVPFFAIPHVYDGPLTRQLGGVDVSWLVGLIVPGLVYYFLSRSIDLTAEQPAVAQSERELQALETPAH